jgi:hypothetical protein
LNVHKRSTMNLHWQHKRVLHHQQHKGIFHLCQPNLQQLHQRMTPCRLIGQDSNPSQSKKINVDVLWRTKSCCSWVPKEVWITCNMHHLNY